MTRYRQATYPHLVSIKIKLCDHSLTEETKNIRPNATLKARMA